MQVGSGDTAHGVLPWRVSSLATHAERVALIRIIYFECCILKKANAFMQYVL